MQPQDEFGGWADRNGGLIDLGLIKVGLIDVRLCVPRYDIKYKDISDD